MVFLIYSSFFSLHLFTCCFQYCSQYFATLFHHTEPYLSVACPEGSPIGRDLSRWLVTRRLHSAIVAFYRTITFLFFFPVLSHSFHGLSIVSLLLLLYYYVVILLLITAACCLNGFIIATHDIKKNNDLSLNRDTVAKFHLPCLDQP